MKSSTPSLFRVVREADDPLGVFFRVGKDDHTVIERILDDERVGLLGVVFDACHCSAQHEVRTELLDRQLEAILDTGVMELATRAGHASPRHRLPWATAQRQTIDDFIPSKCDSMAKQIAQFAGTNGFSAVLAPSHFLALGAKDPWLAIDKRLMSSLRRQLDTNGCRNIRIYYPLAIPTQELVGSASRTAIKASLAGLPIDAIWLRVHPFGSHASDTMLQRYILACRDLHGLRLPLIAEKAGVLGVALLAFGAVSGIEAGISSGEKFDIARLNRASSIKNADKPFRKAARVYLPELCTFLSRKQATEFFTNRALRRFSCRDTGCCRHGPESMIKDPRRHFAYTRMGEIAILSRITPSLRPVEYLERILRPSTDNIGRVLAQDSLSDALKAKFEKSRRKQDRWRDTLGRMSSSKIVSFAVPFERLSRKSRQTA